MTWTDDVARYLLDATTCPRCDTRTWQGAPAMQGGICSRCGTDLTGAAGADVWAASEDVVAAVRRRQTLVDALPTAVTRVTSAVASSAVPASAGVPYPAAARPAQVTSATRR